MSVGPGGWLQAATRRARPGGARASLPARRWTLPVRLSAGAASLLAAGALAGCGGEGEEAAWKGPPEPDAEGRVAVDSFAAYQEQVDEPWEGAPAMAAGEFLRLDGRSAARTTIESTAEGEGVGPQTVVVTLDGLPDDSIRTERWTLAFEPTDGTYRLTAARRELRCHPGRGHEGFSPVPCL